MDKQPDFLTRHFGSVVTALVTLAGLGFAAYQFTAQDARAEREQRLALSRFVVEHYHSLFDDHDDLRRARMRAVMDISFPPELVDRFAEAQEGRMTAILPDQRTADSLRRVTEGLADIPQSAPSPTGEVVVRPRAAPVLPATAFLHIGAEGDRDTGRALRAALEGVGVRVPGIEHVDAVPNRGDVRYFHHRDADRAAQALSLLRDALPPGAPLRDAPQFLGDDYPNVAEGVIEVWLPPLGG